MYKNTIKGATQANGHSLKLHICILETSQVKHNNSNCHFFWEYFSLIAKFTCSQLDTNKKMFLHVQSTQTSRMDNLYFFQMSFFSTKCAPFLLKIGEDFNIDD
jgi:hypothetical protein